eukprot:TRINITY_DN17180_c0_g1_i1.p1 TRINITY_DN17180_c0_g1~~TRINITY_DN17180_c0_g1_i1.p1  ORF type:complete len:441 (-),score=71.05 TRINITY_DN17180_c0_g1_i1:10-1332(-)
MKKKEDGNSFKMEENSQEDRKQKFDDALNFAKRLDETIHEASDKLKDIRKRLVEGLCDMKDEREHTQFMTKLFDNKKSLSDAIQGLKVERENFSQRLESAKQEMILQILHEADIIACTLSSSGHEYIANMNQDIEFVIVDEAAQAVELSTLIPLQYGAKHVILVGDPHQLPATVLSQIATQYNYETSLFQRLMRSVPVHMLQTQYRMHPFIRTFPSKHFYNDKLIDGKNIKSLHYTKLFHYDGRFLPFLFYDLPSEQSREGGSRSLKNVEEAKFASLLVKSLLNSFPEVKDDISIGVIAPYRQQLHELYRQFKANLPDVPCIIGGTDESDENAQLQNDKSLIEINTVDGFQGREKSVIIFSCVRANRREGIGFLSDIRRLNVALTRAKFSLWIIGNSHSLSSDNTWRSLIEHAKRSKSYMPKSIIHNECGWTQTFHFRRI